MSRRSDKAAAKVEAAKLAAEIANNAKEQEEEALRARMETRGHAPAKLTRRELKVARGMEGKSKDQGKVKS